MNIRGPFSYSGNKYRIYSKYLKNLMSKFERVHEPFCGSGVCLYNANNGGIGMDIDNNVIQLHQAIFDKNLISKIQREYKNFFPNGKTEDGFYSLREEFNKSWRQYGTTSENIHMLHLLIQLSFNSLLRFGPKGFNTPFGRKELDLEKIRLHQNIVFQKDIEFIQGDYHSFNLDKVNKDKDLIYFDPPYLASKLTYGGWNKKNEEELLRYISNLDDQGYKFILSNTFYHRGINNNILVEWSKNYTIQHLKMSYNAWTAAVRSVETAKCTHEVIITNILGKTLPLF